MRAAAGLAYSLIKAVGLDPDHRFRELRAAHGVTILNESLRGKHRDAVQC